MDKSEKIMTDINKTIEWLKELEAKATPGEWEVGPCKTTIYDKDGSYLGDFARLPHYATAACNAALTTATRNALPELLAELERLEARAEKAEAERDVLLQHIAKLSCDVCPAHECPGICSCEDYIAEWAEREAASTGQQSEAEGREEA